MNTLETQLKEIERTIAAQQQIAAQLRDSLEIQHLNHGILPWGIVEKGELPMYLAQDPRGIRNLQLYKFVSHQSKEYGSELLYIARPLDKYISLTGKRVVHTARHIVDGVVPKNFRVFDSKEEGMELAEARVQDATYRSVAEIYRDLRNHALEQVLAAAVSQEWGFGGERCILTINYIG